MKLKGGSLKVKEIKAFLEASYEEDPPKEIMGYQLDEKLSFLYGKVYVNHKSKKLLLHIEAQLKLLTGLIMHYML